MPRPSDPPAGDALRDAVIGLGARSLRKTYFGPLRESLGELARFRTLLDEAREGFAVVELPGRQVADANRGARRLLSLDDLVGRPLRDGFTAEEWPRVEAVLAGAAAGGASGPAQVTLRRGQEARVLELSAQQLVLDGAACALVVLRDVTELERAAAEDRMVTALLRTLTLASPGPVLLERVVELLAEFTGCSGVAIRVREGDLLPFGASRGLPPSLVSEDGRLHLGVHQCACTRVVQGAPCPADAPAWTPGGSFHCSSLQGFAASLPPEALPWYRGLCVGAGYETHAVVPVPFEGAVVGAILVMDERLGRLSPADVRTLEKIAPVVGEILHKLRAEVERRQMEARLAASERLASLGTLAAGLAHEINNPLAYISGNLEYLGEILEGLPGAPPSAAEALADTRAGVSRVRAIVQDMSAFSRSDAEGPGAPVDVRLPLQSALAMAQNEIRHRARLRVELEAVPPVEAVEHRLTQVFLNLVLNAAQAIPEGRAEANEIRVACGVAPDGRVRVEVSDTGSGMPEEVRGRIFEPFFTTKPVGAGTGLGLSIVHGVISALNGHIEVDSTPGGGSTFRVLLPPSARAAATAGPARAGAPAQAAARILVVDDDPLVGRALARTLGRRHQVQVTAEAPDALRRLLAGERFDVVICDLMMPTLTGMELHARLRAAAPEVADRMLFTTGGAFTAEAARFADGLGDRCLTKPVDGAALDAAIARVLAGPRA